MLQADMQDQLNAVQQHLQDTINEKDHVASELGTELRSYKMELSALKVSRCSILSLSNEKVCPYLKLEVVSLEV